MNGDRRGQCGYLQCVGGWCWWRCARVALLLFYLLAYVAYQCSFSCLLLFILMLIVLHRIILIDSTLLFCVFVVVIVCCCGICVVNCCFVAMMIAALMQFIHSFCCVVHLEGVTWHYDAILLFFCTHMLRARIICVCACVMVALLAHYSIHSIPLFCVSVCAGLFACFWRTLACCLSPILSLHVYGRTNWRVLFCVVSDAFLQWYATILHVIFTLIFRRDDDVVIVCDDDRALHCFFLVGVFRLF